MSAGPLAYAEGGRVLKKLLTFLVIAFAVFYLLSAPRDAAEAVRSALNGLQDAAESLTTFFENLV